MRCSLTLAKTVGFLGILAIIVLSLLPGSDRPHTGLPGKAEHFIAYCFTASALAFGFRSRASWVVIAIGVTLLAGSMEILQLWVPGRHSDIGDAFVSSLGGLLGIVLGGTPFWLKSDAALNRRRAAALADRARR
ncbi:VanZ family protein [Methylocapsa polymorpha]|uniref:VanZ family protein n=1 Tax=Methylocapsa polymorpha TaxID=3080828 RepID=UPI00388CFA30